ncbi:VOC family protein [Streptosporangium sp. NPDC000396]|uniref:VOC family protein n=1 Tax=Streptosporangium sp. NPDC000396 TaxID=3366185 RepID=UPI0036CDEB05
MSELTGFSHIALSVADRDASVRWYSEVLGFKEIAVLDSERWLRTICFHDSLAVVGFTQHLDREEGGFDHRRTGVDHVAFGVGSREALDEWARRFAELGVTHSPVEESPFGPLLSFRDPDGIQLELFFTQM